MPQRILIIAPHADDEVLGCGGTIARRTAHGDRVDVVVFAVGGIKHHHLDVQASLQQRIDEFQAASDVMGVTDRIVLFEGMDMRLDTLPHVELVSKLDNLIARGYDEVYFPYASFNHDHREVFNASYSALRMNGSKKTPKLSVLYEYPLVSWNATEIRGGYMYVDVSEFIETKIRALNAYKSQVRTFPHPCSPEAVRAFAAMRGVESGCTAAELFYLQRIVV